MKKLLGIVVLGFLLSAQSFAASESLYLTCPRNITEDNSADHIKEFHKSLGKIHQYYYFDIKIKKSKVEIKVYSHAPDPDKTWSNVKPTIFLNSKFEDNKAGHVEDGSYFIMFEPDGIEGVLEYFQIYKNSSSWAYKGRTVMKLDSIDVDFKHGGDCNLHEKKEFNKLRKKGVSVN
tara:strand:+ start:131 stop:658 length:528 start_codon:yes stop_codon:yes gene_type:complete